jgi:hypothetical protein
MRSENQDSIVGTQTGYGTDGPGFESGQGQEISCSLKTEHTGSEAHIATYSMGTGVLSRGGGLK